LAGKGHELGRGPETSVGVSETQANTHSVVQSSKLSVAAESGPHAPAGIVRHLDLIELQVGKYSARKEGKGNSATVVSAFSAGASPIARRYNVPGLGEVWGERRVGWGWGL
jgi:hypothetical protein